MRIVKQAVPKDTTAVPNRSPGDAPHKRAAHRRDESPRTLVIESRNAQWRHVSSSDVRCLFERGRFDGAGRRRDGLQIGPRPRVRDRQLRRAAQLPAPANRRRVAAGSRLWAARQPAWSGCRRAAEGLLRQRPGREVQGSVERALTHASAQLAPVWAEGVAAIHAYLFRGGWRRPRCRTGRVHGGLCRRGVLSPTVTEPRLLRTQNLRLCRLRRRARACAPQNLCGTWHRERAPPARPRGRLTCEARTSTAVGEFLRLLYSAHWLTAVSPYSGVPSLGEASGCGTAARAALGEASERAALSPPPPPPVSLRSSARVRWCARSLLAASERCTRRRRVRLSRTLDCWPRGEPATGVGDAEPCSSSRSRFSAQALRSLCAACVRRTRGHGRAPRQTHSATPRGDRCTRACPASSRSTCERSRLVESLPMACEEKAGGPAALSFAPTLRCCA